MAATALTEPARSISIERRSAGCPDNSLLVGRRDSVPPFLGPKMKKQTDDSPLINQSLTCLRVFPAMKTRRNTEWL